MIKNKSGIRLNGRLAGEQEDRWTVGVIKNKSRIRLNGRLAGEQVGGSRATVHEEGARVVH